MQKEIWQSIKRKNLSVRPEQALSSIANSVSDGTSTGDVRGLNVRGVIPF